MHADEFKFSLSLSAFIRVHLRLQTLPLCASVSLWFNQSLVFSVPPRLTSPIFLGVAVSDLPGVVMVIWPSGVRVNAWMISLFSPMSLTVARSLVKLRWAKPWVDLEKGPRLSRRSGRVSAPRRRRGGRIV